MEFLTSCATNQQNEQKLKILQKKKQDLTNKLQNLKNQQFEIVCNRRDESELVTMVTEVDKMRDILDAYNLQGVNIESLGPELVLSFSPTYGNVFTSSERYSVQFVRKGDNYIIETHNLPPFIHVNQLQNTYSTKPLSEFVEKIRQLLYVYVQRRDGLKSVKENFKDNLEGKPEVNLAVTYVKIGLFVSDQLPRFHATLQYSQDKCLPDTVNITLDDSEETYTISKKNLDQLINKWTRELSSLDIYTAVSNIVRQ